MKRLFFSWFLISIVCFSGCAGFQGKPRPVGPLIEEIPPELNLSWEILDYRDKDSGGDIPLWLSSYLEGGIPAVEKQKEYENYYVFISMNSGSNLGALEQWNIGFSPNTDFARLAADRIERRFLKAAGTYPDDEYGSFFLALIRAASDALWQGVVRDSDFWLLLHSPEADGAAQSRETYNYFILVKGQKALLVPQIRALIQDVKPDDPLSTEQNAAINRVRERFFEGF
jgi:hypothetical protein